MDAIKRFSSILKMLVCILTLPAHLGAESYPRDISSDSRLDVEAPIHCLRDNTGLVAVNPAGPTTVLACGEPNFDINDPANLSRAAKKYILCRMNEIRSQVALHKVADDGTDGRYPFAANMRRMMWDEDLATVAGNFAAQCHFSHNPNRNSQYAALSGASGAVVGENIAMAWGTPPFAGSSTAVAEIETAISRWNAEGSQWHFSKIDSGSVAAAGHFTQDIWAGTTRVGCGQAWCPYRGRYEMIFTVCNFYPAGNYSGQYPYVTGSEVCSVGVNPTDTCENGLITPADYTTKIAFDSDVGGDGQAGLPEEANTLKLLSGAAQ